MNTSTSIVDAVRDLGAVQAVHTALLGIGRMERATFRP
jgi:hypothetical protein